MTLLDNAQSVRPSAELHKIERLQIRTLKPWRMLAFERAVCPEQCVFTSICE
jgi:hypothetical protein